MWPTKLGVLAGELVSAAADGDERAFELAINFAEAVNEQLEPLNRLVIAILTGGPLTVRRGLELAELVLQSRQPADGAVQDASAGNEPS